MTHKNLLTLLALTTTLIACDMRDIPFPEPEPQNNWKGMNLHGKVKTMEVITEIIADSLYEENKNASRDSTVISFSITGNIEQYKSYDNDKKLYNNIEYTYNAQNKILSETFVEFNDDGSPSDRKVTYYKYNSVGQLIQEDERINNLHTKKIIYVYDDEGKRIQENEFTPAPIGREDELYIQKAYSYDDKYYDVVITTTNLRARGVPYVAKYKYHNNKKPIEILFGNKEIFTYNDNNDVISQKTFSDEKLKTETINKYQYDEQRNRIKVITELDGKLFSVETIKYEYYKNLKQ